MSNYAQIVNGIVVNVIVADADFVATQTDKTYVLCTRGGIGWTYDDIRDEFVAPQPFESWTLDENNDWQPPTPMPSSGGPYRWSEEDLEWVAI
jgi:hypothetical protein